MASSPPDLYETVRRLEQDLGIAPGFLEGLIKVDDWTLVIQAHALVEAALTHVIVEAIGQPALSDVIGTLSIGDSRHGKITIAEKLSLVDAPRVKFFRTLGSIRNRFMHDVKNVGLRIETYAQTLSPNAQKDLWEAIARGYTSLPEIEAPAGTFTPTPTFASRNPKFMMWIATMNSIALLYHVKTIPEVRAILAGGPVP